MNKNNGEGNISSKELACFLIKNVPTKMVISEVFKLFSASCIDFYKINPRRLDDFITEFNEKETEREKALIKIIELLRSVSVFAKFASLTLKYNTTLAREIENYIEEHLFEDFQLKEMANELNISYYYMCHLFKEYKGMSIVSYKNMRRLQCAERLLVASDKKISDIAAECGYDSISYFTENFTKAYNCSPTKFRVEKSGRTYFEFYGDEDVSLANLLEECRFLSEDLKENTENVVKTYEVHEPDKEYKWLHESAIIKYHGILFAAWYNCPEKELEDAITVRSRYSSDDGKSWSEPFVVDNEEGKLFCPPVFGICDDKLYMFINEMVAGDRIHALNLYVLDEKNMRFSKLWSRPVPFKLNTNVMHLPNGKLMLSGRVGVLDGFVFNTPAVLISDSGEIDAEWRMVIIAQDGILPDGESLACPEICPIIMENKIVMFCRNDLRKVPLIYISEDCGESWTGPCTHDIPVVSSKMYAGVLENGRSYLVCNVERMNRTRLAIYFSEKNSLIFNERLILHDDEKDAAHYPVVYEADGKLYIIYTINYEDWEKRGARLAVIDLKDI